MKINLLTLCAAALLAGCGQSAPDTSTPTAAAPAAPVPVVPADTTATVVASAPVAAEAPAAAPSMGETLKLSFSFKPAPNADDPAHPRTSAHLLLQGAKPMNIDLGKFAAKPDQVDAAKAKLAGFPSGMLLGFRSYDPSSGTSQDLAVLNVDARHLRVVQRRVEETATEPGKFETSREVPIPANTVVTVAPMPAAAKPAKK